jgi:hypothetical protein
VKVVLDTNTRLLNDRGRLNPTRSKEFVSIESALSYLDAWMRKYAPNVRSADFMAKVEERMRATDKHGFVGFSWDFRTPANHLARINVYVNALSTLKG